MNTTTEDISKMGDSRLTQEFHKLADLDGRPPWTPLAGRPFKVASIMADHGFYLKFDNHPGYGEVSFRKSELFPKETGYTGPQYHDHEEWGRLILEAAVRTLTDNNNEENEQ